jgi:hypothetical protein
VDHESGPLGRVLIDSGEAQSQRVPSPASLYRVAVQPRGPRRGRGLGHTGRGSRSAHDGAPAGVEVGDGTGLRLGVSQLSPLQQEIGAAARPSHLLLLRGHHTVCPKSYTNRALLISKALRYEVDEDLNPGSTEILHQRLMRGANSRVCNSIAFPNH